MRGLSSSDTSDWLETLSQLSSSEVMLASDAWESIPKMVPPKLEFMSICDPNTLPTRLMFLMLWAAMF